MESSTTATSMHAGEAAICAESRLETVRRHLECGECTACFAVAQHGESGDRLVIDLQCLWAEPSFLDDRSMEDSFDRGLIKWFEPGHLWND